MKNKIREQEDLIQEFKSLVSQYKRIAYIMIYENYQDYKRIREITSRLKDIREELEILFSKGDLDIVYNEVYCHGDNHRWDWEIEESKLIAELSSLGELLRD